MKRFSIMLMFFALITCFYGIASADPDGSEGYNCSSCHRGMKDQTPPGSRPNPTPTPTPTPTPQPPVLQLPPMQPNPGPFVGLPPVAEAGANLTVLPGAYGTLNGLFSNDIDGRITSYVWVQTGGTPVQIYNPWTATSFFVAPNTAQTLAFTLIVSDDNGNLGADTVTVTVLGDGNNSGAPSDSGGNDRGNNNNNDDDDDDDDDDD